MRLDLWARCLGPIEEFAALWPLKVYWLDLMRRPLEEMPKDDRAVVSALSEMNNANAVAVVRAVSRWASELQDPSAPVTTADLRARVAELDSRGEGADTEALDRLLTALVRQASPPGLLAALRVSLSGGKPEGEA